MARAMPKMQTWESPRARGAPAFFAKAKKRGSCLKPKCLLPSWKKSRTRKQTSNLRPYLHNLASPTTTIDLRIDDGSDKSRMK